MLLTFPNKQEVEVIFDEVAHSYVVRHKLHNNQWSDFRPTHGITAPLAVVPKAFLTPWGSKEGVHATLEYLMNHPEAVDSLPLFFEHLKAHDERTRTPEDKPVMSGYKFKKLYPWYPELKKAYQRKATIGKELGTWIHLAVEDYYRSGRTKKPIITPEVQGMWDSFIQFDNFFKPTPDSDGLEFIVYSLLFGYSGQGDFRGRMNGKTVILDWKSTNRSASNKDGISPDYFFQLGGLAQAEFERTGVWVEDLGAVNFDKKGDEPRVIWASEFGMSPQDAARAYISCFNNYHMIGFWEFKYHKR